MRVSLKVVKNGEEKAIPLYNSFVFDERIDEELDGGATETYTESKEALCEYDAAFVTLTDDSGSRTIPFFAFDDVSKRGKDYYNHNIELVEPTRWLMGLTIDGLAVTQPIDETATKKTLFVVLERVLRCYTASGKKPVFEIDAQTRAILSAVVSPEFRWKAQTLLFEVLQDIADVVDCIPRLTIAQVEKDLKFIVAFDKVNESAGKYSI